MRRNRVDLCGRPQGGAYDPVVSSQHVAFRSQPSHHSVASAIVIEGHAPAEHGDALGHFVGATTAEEGRVLPYNVDETIHKEHVYSHLTQASIDQAPQ